jgi:hypothetical protein
MEFTEEQLKEIHERENEAYDNAFKDAKYKYNIILEELLNTVDSLIFKVDLISIYKAETKITVRELALKLEKLIHEGVA